jgi:hypothetical protein
VKLSLFLFYLFALLTCSFSSRADEVIRAKYGPEFTFTNQEIIDASKGVKDSNNPVNREYLSKWIDEIKKLCAEDGCEVVETKDKHGVAHRVTFPDGNWIQYGNDTAVLEVQTNPRTAAEFKKDRDLLDKYIFQSAKNIGMTPHERIGGGHVNIDLKTGFKNDATLFRNFLVDQANHPERVFGIFGNHLGNSPPISSLKPKSHKAFKKLIENFDKSPLEGHEGISHLSYKVKNDVYTNNPYKWTPSRYYQNLNFRFVDSSTPEPERRIEVRGHHPQRSIDEFIAQTDFYDMRLTSLANLEELVPVGIPSKDTFDDMTKAKKMKAFVTTFKRMGVNIEDINPALIPERMKISFDYELLLRNQVLESEQLKKQFPESVQKLLDWGLNANSAAKNQERKAPFFKVGHYEVPTSLVSLDYLDSLDPKIKNELVFTRDGQEYVKWIINPEDTKYHLEVRELLEKSGHSFKVHYELLGGLTSSRSMIITNPETDVTFSIKVSTNKTGGRWQNKGVNETQVKKALIADNAQEAAQKYINFETLEVQKETMGGVIKDLNQGFIIRELDDSFLKGEKIYLPGFSILDENVGKEIAKLNGYDDPVEFLRDAYYKPLGSASAELQARTGLSFNSAHSQQYLIEFDKDMKPTGKIIFRDIADSDAWRTFYKGDNKFFKTWKKKYFSRGIKARSGTLHGMKAPSWIDKDVYADLNKSWFDSYAATLSKETGIPISEIRSTKFKGDFEGYFSSSVRSKGFLGLTQTKKWKDYKDLIPCFRGLEKSIRGLDCKQALRDLRALVPSNAKGASCIGRAFQKVLLKPVAQ